MIHASLGYRVFFTPLIQSDQSVYGDEIEVTDRILSAGIGNIKQSIDAGDYDIGVFAFSDLELKGANFNGYFNEEDSRSIFITTRDRCKVRVVFRRNVFERNSSGTILSSTETDTVTFRGLINEEATRLDLATDQIRFKVLSRDSVLRTTQIPAGVVGDDTPISEAIFRILNQTRITSVLTIDQSNIVPDLDIEVDDGDWFSNKGVKEALDKLLFASNSVLLIDDDGTVHVRSRDHDSDDDFLLNLYGQYDQQKRENIIKIEDYNLGRQRMFTSVRINDTISTNEIFADAFGLRVKKYSLEFIDDPDKEEEIAERVVDEFKTPKIEMNVTVATDLVRDLQLLQVVSVNYPLRVEPIKGTFLPVFDVAKFSDANTPFPNEFGSVSIDRRTAFKVVEISHEPEKFTSKLKLRQIGVSLEDGFFNVPANNKFGFGIFGIAMFGTDVDPSETWNPSNLGAARFSLTRFE